MPDTILEPPPHTAPVVFTRALLDWLPWLEPLAVEALTERHMAALVDAARAKSAYFRLLARDPDALKARTLTDKDIFYNPDAGLPRAEREGVTYLPGRYFAVSRPQPNGLRISFAGMTPEEIRTGLAILGRIFQNELERARTHAPLMEAAALV